MRPIDLTISEWKSLGHLQDNSGQAIPRSDRAKLLLLGIVAEKAGKLVLTFEGRLQLREYNNKMPSSS